MSTVKLDVSSLTLGLYAQRQLIAAVSPDDAFDKTVTWSSSDPAVATVDENGLITPVKAGSCTITATAHSLVYASCRLTIKDTKPTALEFDAPFVTLNPGDTKALATVMTPAAAQNSPCKYSSSDRSVVTVDENGVITAVSTGSAIITAASVSSSSVKNTCKVFVISEDAKPLEGVVIGINPGHQKVPINKLYPIAPGSSTMKAGCKAGATGVVTKMPEHETNLNASLILRDVLVSQGAKVIMTRTVNDVSLTNIDRAYMLNAANVDAAIQVHCDGGAASAMGMSSYYRTTGEWVQESKLLATALLRGMQARTGAVSKGTQICNTYMSLNYSFTPACLVELGYLTNKTEDVLINDPDYQLKLAWGICDGLLEYFGR